MDATRRAVLGGLVAMTAFADPARAEDKKPDKRLLIDRFRLTLEDERLGRQLLTVAFIVIAQERDILVMERRMVEIRNGFTLRIRDMRVPDLEGAAGHYRVREIMMDDVLRPLSREPGRPNFAFTDVVLHEFTLARR